jgi:hypothetical protein
MIALAGGIFVGIILTSMALAANEQPNAARDSAALKLMDKRKTRGFNPRHEFAAQLFPAIRAIAIVGTAEES